MQTSMRRTDKWLGMASHFKPTAAIRSQLILNLDWDGQLRLTTDPTEEACFDLSLIARAGIFMSNIWQLIYPAGCICTHI